MKKITLFLSLTLLCATVSLSSFSPKQQQQAQVVDLRNYAWYTPAGQFVAWSQLLNAEVVTDADTNPVNGTLVLEGYTEGGPNLPPSGTLVYKLYTHP